MRRRCRSRLWRHPAFYRIDCPIGRFIIHLPWLPIPSSLFQVVNSRKTLPPLPLRQRQEVQEVLPGEVDAPCGRPIGHDLAPALRGSPDARRSIVAQGRGGLHRERGAARAVCRQRIDRGPRHQQARRAGDTRRPARPRPRGRDRSQRPRRGNRIAHRGFFMASRRVELMRLCQPDPVALKCSTTS